MDPGAAGDFANRRVADDAESPGGSFGARHVRGGATAAAPLGGGGGDGDASGAGAGDAATAQRTRLEVGDEGGVSRSFVSADSGSRRGFGTRHASRLADAATQAGLPPGWRAIVAPDEDVYYASDAGDVTWTRPATSPGLERAPTATSEVMDAFTVAFAARKVRAGEHMLDPEFVASLHRHASSEGGGEGGGGGDAPPPPPPPAEAP